MDLGGDLPVTLVVKAANQRVADQTVECVLGWTIRKLKQHLESVYPSKPKHHQQKLIYSGQLLADHLTLKEVLRQYDQTSQHTVHLVCSPSVETLSQPGPTQNVSSTEKKSEPLTSTTQSSISTPNGSDGLRHRGTSVSSSQSEGTNAGGNQAAAMPGGAGMEGMAGMMGMGGMPMMPNGAPGMMGMPGYAYTPEQIAWMQQMYSQYMAQYMQYYGYQMPAPAQPANPIQAPAPQPAANPAAANNAPPNQNMRMNAQGGMEEDDEEEHRDWLDYIYVCFRFMVLVSIVYFYSSASRFLTVAIGFFAVYMIQNGWWIWNRRQQQQQQEAQQPPAQPQQQQQQPEQPPQQQQQQNPAEGQNNAGTEERREEEGGGAAAPAGTSPPVVDPQQEVPSTPVVLLRMLVSFFTSLVPAPPPAVNGN